MLRTSRLERELRAPRIMICASWVAAGSVCPGRTRVLVSLIEPCLSRVSSTSFWIASAMAGRVYAGVSSRTKLSSPTDFDSADSDLLRIVDPITLHT